MKNDMARNLIIGAMFRFITVYSRSFFYPIYYKAAFADEFQTFSEYNALFLAGFGFIASLSAGVLSDKLNAKNPDENPDTKLVLASSLISVPFQAMMLLSHNSFGWSMFALGAQYITVESWLPPYLTALRQSVKPEQRGFVTTLYTFCATASGTLSTYLLDKAIRWHPESVGPMDFSQPGSWEGFAIFGFNAISLLGAVPFMIAGGREFDRRRK